VNKSELIDHVAMTTSIDDGAAMLAVRTAPRGIVSTLQGRERVSLLGLAASVVSSRVAGEARNPRLGAPMLFGAFQGVRSATGSPFAAALNAKSGATQAAPAKAAKAPAKAFVASSAPAAVVTGAKKR